MYQVILPLAVLVAILAQLLVRAEEVYTARQALSASPPLLEGEFIRPLYSLEPEASSLLPRALL